ncbi:MAG: 16S rRNA (cytidine(1402)-2'-O)-methyltransferase [Gemmatimonadales bacterium]|nr:MAG: 16S rRNA (cytidine(1402)-2'-O)-methyltransferase [Gemmatimonadales bacterium]
MGTLYLISTPIGNLEDLTFRAARILGEVDLVLAEDTRRTLILLNHLGIRVPLESLHEHNEAARIPSVLERLRAGGTLALVSDAGTPLVSDPGERLVPQVMDDGHRVVPIPGPSAVLTALVASGLPSIPFAFLGFVPRKGRERREMLERIRTAPETTVVFESPERCLELLEALEPEWAEGREVAVARELTKLHEEVRRGTPSALAGYYRENPPRGEVTVVVAPAGTSGDGAEADAQAVRALARALLDQGRSPSRAAREVADRLRVPRNQAYSLVQEVAADPESDGS